MKTQRFSSLAEAERDLARRGFRFQGAPSRWRRLLPGKVEYADVVSRGRAIVVFYTEVGRTDPPVTGAGLRVIRSG